MALPRKFKHMNIFNDGQNYMGIAEEVTLPKLTRKLETYRGGGMNGSAQIDMGLDDGALDMEITLGGMEAQIYRQWGIETIDGVQLRFHGSIQRDDIGEVHAVEMVVRGRYSEIDSGNVKEGDNSQTKLSVKPTYFRLEINGEKLIEIDIINMIEIVGGVDRMAAHRAALGL